MTSQETQTTEPGVQKNEWELIVVTILTAAAIIGAFFWSGSGPEASAAGTPASRAAGSGFTAH